MTRCTNPLRLLIGILLLLATGSEISAQEKQAITDVLDRLGEKHEVTFSYNSLLLEDLLVERPISENDLSITLKEIETSSPLKFELIGDDYYTIIPIRSDFNFEVLDKQTGENIPVVLAQINQKKTAYIYPSTGGFTLLNVFLTDSICISSRFYQPFKFSVQESGTNPTIKLDQDTLYLEDVTVESYIISGINAKVETQSVVVNTADLGLVAGETDGDIFQVLKTIPGIKSPTGKAGALMIRGSTYDQNLMFFDDIPLYHTGHYFGTISPYNQAIVDEVEVYRGSLPVERGGKVGGLVDIRTSRNIPKKISGGVLANTVYAGANLTIPIIKEKMALSISARSNYPDYESLKMESFTILNMQGSKLDENLVGQSSSLDEFDVKFNDLNTKLTFRPNSNQELTFSALRIKNDFGFLFSSPDQDLVETEESALNNWGATTKWDAIWSSKWRTTIGVTASVFDLMEERKAIASGIEEEVVQSLNTIEDIRVRTTANYELNQSTSFVAGYEMTNQQVDFEESGVDRDGNPQERQTSDLAQIHSGYLNVKKRMGTKFLIDAGLHMDLYSLTQNWYADPRLMLSYFMSKAFYLKSSIGVSHQYLQRQFSNDFDDFKVSNQFWFLAEKNLPVQKGTQYMIGAMWDKYGWLIDLEIYKKNTYGISRQAENNQIEVGNLENIGLDLLIKKRFTSFDLWCSYTLGNSTTNFNIKEDAYFDQTHVLNLMFLIPRDRWNFSLAWGLMSGMPVQIPESTGSPNQSMSTLNVPYQERFPVQHQLDMSATYQFSKPQANWKGVVGISILNVYDTDNVINIFQTNTNPESPYRLGVGISPNIQVSISW